MRYAENKNGKRIQVSNSCEEAICPHCGETVVGRIYKEGTDYWKHRNKKECDSWYEPTTDWHIKWQNFFPEEQQEVTLYDEKTNITHRADVCTNNGFVIEVQNSPISVDEIAQRETFYGRKGMVWILNGENLLKKSNIVYNEIRKVASVDFSLPDYLPEIKEYRFDYISQELYESKVFNQIAKHPNYNFIDNPNGNNFSIQFYDEIKFDVLIDLLRDSLYNITNKLFGLKNCKSIMNKIIITHNYIDKDYFKNVKLSKKYWRKFIDLMKHPVYIDNLNGISDDYIYFYQANSIIKKDEFIRKLKNE